MTGDVGRVGTRVVVTGLVQGVFFRDSCRREAHARGLSGWVRNKPDGSVEAVFEGDPADVETLVAWMRVGPRQARVRSVEVSRAPLEGRDGFQVR
jgi:acylphosphatase